MSRSRMSRGAVMFLPKTARDHLRHVSIIIILVVLLVVFFMQRAEHPIASHTRQWMQNITSPLLQVVTVPVRATAGIKERFRAYFFAVDDNQELRRINRRLEQQVVILLDQVAETQRLKRLMRVVEQGYTPIVTADVITDASGPFARSILISAGSDQGIEKGMAAVNEEGLVGRVIEVNKTNARVLLITDINARIPVVGSVSRERSILAGDNTDYPELTYVPRDTQLQMGERVVTSGEGALFPAGIEVGKVLVSENAGLRLVPSVTWHRLEVVSILKPGILPSSASTTSVRE